MPVPHRQSFDCGLRGLQSALETIRTIDDPDLQDIALLALAMVCASTLPKGEAALAVQNERQFGVRMVGAAPELAYLRGDTATAARDIGGYRSARVPPAAFARRLARTYSWTPWRNLAQTLVRPAATAITSTPKKLKVAMVIASTTPVKPWGRKPPWAV